jgi:hypothetical protein
VQISLSRLNEINLSADKSTVEIGAGLKWDAIYEKLDGTGVNVVGARVPGIGVGGFVTGGGALSPKDACLILMKTAAQAMRGTQTSTVSHLTMSASLSSCYRMEQSQLSRSRIRIFGLVCVEASTTSASSPR